MKHQIHRRSFLKNAAVVGGSLMTADTVLSKPLVAADTSKPAPSSVQPSEAHKAWSRLRYGLFLHFGPNTLTGSGWGDGKFPAAEVVFPKLNLRQWAEVAAEAGMKYAVLTTKHHDGFCLWPSRHTEYCIKNSPQKRDIVGEFVTDFGKMGIQTGFYYSTWDRNHPQYGNDAVYAEYMRNQLRELLTAYGPAVECWFDGSWDKDHPTRQWAFDPAWESDPNSGLRHGERYGWEALYRLIHQLQDDCLVFHNSSSDRPGQIRYFPVDGRTAEHFDFVYQGRVVEPGLDPVFTKPDGQRVYLPLQFETTISPGWFWRKQDELVHTSAGAIADWYRRAQAAKANLLLNVGPDRDGLIPEYNRHFLRCAARELGLV